MENVIFADSPLASYLEGEGEHEPSWIKAESANHGLKATDTHAFAPHGYPAFLAKLKAGVRQPVRLSTLQQSYFTKLRRFYSSQLGNAESERFVEHFRYLLVASQLLDERLGQINSSNTATSHAVSANGSAERGYSTVDASFEGALSCTVLVLALAWLLHRIRDHLSQKGATSSLFIVLVVCATVTYIGWSYVHTRWLCTIRQRTIDVASILVANLRAFEASTSNALLYIQEVELVSRGYQISSPLPPITRLDDNSPVRRCFPLRQSLKSSYGSVLPAISVAYDSLRALAPNDHDFEKYLEIYDIVDTDVAEARLGYREAEFEDMDTLKVLRVLSYRLTVLRRITLCSLMAIPADGSSLDFERWRSVAAVMQNLASVTGEASEKVNEISAKEDQLVQSSPSNRVVAANQERLQSQVRKLTSLSQGMKGLQAKLQILREESENAIGVTEEEFAGTIAALASQYDSVGDDLRQLMYSWEAGKASLVLNMERQERRLSVSHGRSISSSVRSSGVRSPASSISGQTAVEDGSPTAALRALNGEAMKAVTRTIGGGKSSKRSSLAVFARPISIASSNDISGRGSGASASGSAASDEEVFEAIAIPRKRMSMTREERMSMTREERMMKIQEDQARQKMLRDRRETTTNMMRELESVICLRQPSPRGRGNDGDQGGKRATSMW